MAEKGCIQLTRKAIPIGPQVLKLAQKWEFLLFFPLLFCLEQNGYNILNYVNILYKNILLCYFVKHLTIVNRKTMSDVRTIKGQSIENNQSWLDWSLLLLQWNQCKYVKDASIQSTIIFMYL